MARRKRRLGDRKDAYLIKGLDGMHYTMPFIYKTRTENEAFILEKYDLTNLNTYLEKLMKIAMIKLLFLNLLILYF